MTDSQMIITEWGIYSIESQGIRVIVTELPRCPSGVDTHNVANCLNVIMES